MGELGPGKARRLVRKFGAVAAGLAAAGTLGLAAFAWHFAHRPLPEGLTSYLSIGSVRLLDREGGLLRELRASDEGRSIPVDVKAIPVRVRQAFLAAEDGAFFEHGGLSAKAIARSAMHNLLTRRALEGGSTITQQLTRMLVPRPRTLAGKLREALWALRLEAQLGKEEILSQYLNRVPLGNGAFGIEAAAQIYFGRPARHLSLAQAAALASLPRAPNVFDPRRGGARFRERQAWVLDRMAALGFVDPREAASAGSESLDLKALDRAFRAPHFTTYLAKNLAGWGLGEAAVIETTLDPRLQSEIERGIVEELEPLAERRVGSAAAIVLDNATGEVLAYVGSKGFFDDDSQGQNDGVRMLRQPGSSLKPFAYLAALGDGMTAATILADVETAFDAPEGAYVPRNYDGRTHGPVRLREALANSFNIPAVKVAEALGPVRLLEALHAAGFESLDQDAEHYGLGLVLGDGEVSLYELARAYSGLARGGMLAPLKVIRRALRADGSVISLPQPPPARRFAAPVQAALITDILSDNAARTRAFGADSALRLPFAVAAKTGTSKGYSDNWTAGYTRERTMAVWAGNFDRRPMVQVSGVTGAGPIFARSMMAAMAGMAPRPLIRADGIEQVEICPLSGERRGAGCPAGMPELFAPGTAPRHECRVHRNLAGGLAGIGNAPTARWDSATQGPLLELGDFDDWARREGLPAQPWLAVAGTEEAGGARIVSPRRGDQFELLSDLPLADQEIPVRLVVGAAAGPLELWLDGERWRKLEVPYDVRIPPRIGEHTLSLRREGGTAVVASVQFSVRRESSPY